MQQSLRRNAVAIQCLALASLWVACPLTSWAATSNPAPFSEATITDVLNDVKVIPSSDPTGPGTIATKGMDFKAPDAIETGRRSHAQLTAADGTIARIGSNSMFSLEPNSRTLHLEKGSVLFNSPKGMGGGTIITDSATATVTGTTIIVSATSDGGFKLLVLEGTATMKLPNGQTVTLLAGQMSFVLPASKGGGIGPVLNFDLKQQAQNSSLVNGFTLALPSQNLIVDATNQQQLKVQSGQLSPTNQVVVGASSSTEVTLATVDSLPETPVAAYPDLTLGSTGDETLPSANTFLSPGVTFTAGQVGLPNGIIPGDSVLITGLIGSNISASGNVNLAAVDGLKELDILATNTFTFTTSNQTINLVNNFKTPSLVGPGSGNSGGTPGNSPTNTETSYLTDFTNLSSTLNLHLIAEDGFKLPTRQLSIQSISQDIPQASEEIELDFNPNDNFLTQFTMTSVLDDLSVTGLEVFDDNETSNIQLESLAGNVSGSSLRVIAGYDVVLSSALGGINLTGPILHSGEAEPDSSNITLVTGAGDIVTNSGTIETNFGSYYNGTVNIVSPGNVSVSNTNVLSRNVDFIAGNTLTVNGANLDAEYGPKLTFAGDTVILNNLNLYGCSTVSLYSQNGMLNTNTSVTIPGDVNVGANATWNSEPFTNGTFGTGNGQPHLGLTSDNGTVQTALNTPLVITSNTSSFSPNLTFTDVLFTPGQLGEAYGDSFFAQVHGLIAGAVTINGTGLVNFSSLDSFNREGDLAGTSIAISGCVALTPSDGATLVQLYSMGNITFASGTGVYDASSCFSISVNAIKVISFDNAALSDSMGTLTLNSIDGGIAIKDDSTISSGAGKGSSGNIIINTSDDTAAVLVSNSTVSTTHGPVTINSDNITIKNSSTISAPMSTISLNGGGTGITLDNSTLTAGNCSSSIINLVSYNNISIANNSSIIAYTGSNAGSAGVVLTAAHTVTVINSRIQTAIANVTAVDSISASNVTYANASTVNMQAANLTANNVDFTSATQINLTATNNLSADTLNLGSATGINVSARTINLSNLNFPESSTVNLSSQNGILAPNPNTSAASVVGDVNFIHNVQYNGQPAQNYVPISAHGSGVGNNLPIHISSNVP